MGMEERRKQPTNSQIYINTLAFVGGRKSNVRTGFGDEIAFDVEVDTTRRDKNEGTEWYLGKETRRNKDIRAACPRYELNGGHPCRPLSSLVLYKKRFRRDTLGNFQS